MFSGVIRFIQYWQKHIIIILKPITCKLNSRRNILTWMSLKLLRLSELATTHSTYLLIFRVKLGMDINGNLFAIKRYKKETANLSTLQHELNIMKVLQH